MLAEPLLSAYHDSPRRRSRSARFGHREFLLLGLGLGLGLLAAGAYPRTADAIPAARHAFTLLVAVALLALGLRLLAQRRRPPPPAEPVRVAAAYAVAPLAPPPAAPPTNVLVLSVNGVTHSLRDPPPSELLSDWLRSLGLTGTKIGCGEGGCGACTVIAVGADSAPRIINACLRLLCACDGMAITTVEGLGSQGRGFSPAMAAIAHGQGSQCGFCTPGWVAAMTGLLAAHAQRPGGEGISPKVCACKHAPRAEPATSAACMPSRSS
jgi:xanthine dehydrogenase/oxidase